VAEFLIICGATHRNKPYLTVHNEKVQELYGKTTVNQAEESFSVQLIPASSKPTQKVCLNFKEAIMAIECHVPVFVNDFMLEDRYTRCHWIDQILLQFPVILYKFANGSMIGRCHLFGDHRRV